MRQQNSGKMIANYHTHTWRCKHAFGWEREYIENALEGGIKILGFSDHTPQLFPGGYISGHAMLPSQLEGYVDAVLRMREKYKDDITILLGLEVEYYPALWESLLRMLEPYPIEYLILGQHFMHNQFDDPIYCGVPTASRERLHTYCTQCMEGLETGRITYFAHPDLIHFTGDDAFYEEEMTALCRFCARKDIPLEVNLLGIRGGRNYPRDLFWQIAAREGNRVIYGSDAHFPEHVYVPSDLEEADRLMRRCGIPEERILKKLEI